MTKGLCFLFLFLFTASYAIRTQDRVEYVAAVVEYAPTYSLHKVDRQEALRIMFHNLDGYEKALAQINGNGVQIVVFPEDGLYGAYFPTREWTFPYTEPIPFVINGAPNINPCLNSSMNSTAPVLYKISCLARKYGVVIVLDMADRQPCDKESKGCYPDGYNQYNTQVAVSETGQLLAKYHKSHIYFEPWDNGTQRPVYFDTSFGVRFGMFICFDMMFPEPQLALMKEYGVKDIAYSSWWVNFPPYITGTQTQQAWSRLHGVNLLAAGAGTSWYNSGSGIYSNGQVLQTFYNSGSNPQSKVLISPITTQRLTTHTTATTTITTATTTTRTIGKVSLNLIRPDVSLLKDTDWVVDAFEAVPGKKGNLSVSAGNFTCEGFYVISPDSDSTKLDTFGLVVLNGIYNGLFPAQICALMLCPGTVDKPSCTQYAMQGNTIFDEVAIKGTFASDVQQLAMVAGSNASLIETQKYIVKKDSIQSTQELAGTKLINVGIFGLVWQEGGGGKIGK